MAKIQFNRAVRLGTKTYAAGSVQEITDESVLKHSHFKMFLEAGAIEKFVEKQVKPLAPSTFGKPSQSQGNPSAVDGRVKLGEGLHKSATDKAATAVVPETTIGDDEDEISFPDDDDVEEYKVSKKKKKGKSK